jgi:LCP family protein required for cell wall assembly
MFEHLDDSTTIDAAVMHERVVVAANRHRRRVRSTAVSAMLAPLLVIAGGALYVRHQIHQIKSVDLTELVPAAPSSVVPMQSVASSVASPAAIEAPMNIVFVGSDLRTANAPKPLQDNGLVPTDSERADAIVIVRLDPQRGRIGLLSIPRDLLVQSDGKSVRINSLYESSNPDRLIRALRDVTGLEFNHYVSIDGEGLARMVDVVGGVSLSFDFPTLDRNSGLNVDRGCQVLGGDAIVALVTARNVEEQRNASSPRWVWDPTSDLGRIERQHRVMVALLSKVLANNYSLDEQLSVLREVTSSLTFDSRLTTNDLLAMFRFAQSIGTANVHSYRLDVTGETVQSASVLVADPERTATVVDNMVRGFDEDARSADPSVDLASMHQCEG